MRSLRNSEIGWCRQLIGRSANRAFHLNGETASEIVCAKLAADADVAFVGSSLGMKGAMKLKGDAE